MNELKEVFGILEEPQELASIIFDSTKRNTLENKLQSVGEQFSLEHIENQMNAVSRALISLGASSGDNIAIYGLDYLDALNLYLASGQVGINVVNLSNAKTVAELNEVILSSKARSVFFGDSTTSVLGSDYLDQISTSGKGIFLEYLVCQGNIENCSGNVLTWEKFRKLERLATNWEVGLLRVI